MNIERVKLRDIVNARLISMPVELRATYRGEPFTAVLLENGTIEFKGRVFTAPSMALGAARNLVEGRAIDHRPRPTGGWPYWNYFDEESKKWTPLEVVRRRYLQGSRNAK